MDWLICGWPLYSTSTLPVIFARNLSDTLNLQLPDLYTLWAALPFNRASGVPIIFKIEDDIYVGFMILNDV